MVFIIGMIQVPVRPPGADAQCQFRRQRESLYRGQYEDLRQDGGRGRRAGYHFQ